jgi:hypothetical protein
LMPEPYRAAITRWVKREVSFVKAPTVEKEHSSEDVAAQRDLFFDAPESDLS